VAGWMKPTVKRLQLLQIKEIKRHLAVITATALVILAVVFLTLHLHNENREEVLSQAQHHQLSHAQHLAKQIESFFRLDRRS